MAAMLVLSAVIAVHSVTSVPGPEPVVTEVKEVAFESLIEGRAEEAIRTLEAQRVKEPSDPAVLINLGTAYAKTGQWAKAEAAYKAAMASRVGYELELSDGRWTDSRSAARRGLRSLGTTSLAMR
ncbi:tetratricopeptide repeat protein [Altererythrobacter sp. Root672]|uniref:tetratricopeptide repeat protein n=1 Tax=Altererythrobacter sp. Root672 TaxID=1736584 RepID=UPI0007240C37|nr:tetratricopeptide repeat protein [Altererythrobacter sp. Root672]KRA82833.1 hypothetical protein ASD76_01705 [Altererythrobacter sp. Root672]